MTARGEQPLHLGGPFGLAVLAVFAGLSGLLYFTGKPVTQTLANAPVSTGPSPLAQGTVADPFYAPQPPLAGLPPDNLQRPPEVRPAETKIVIPEPPKSPPPGGFPTARPKAPVPAARPAEAPGDARVIPAQDKGAGSEITYIVRIKGSDAADLIGKTFVKSPGDAKRAWSDLVKERPALSAFRLVEATGSGELILGYTVPAGGKPDFEEVARIQKKLMAIDGVAYADPDQIAHPGKE